MFGQNIDNTKMNSNQQQINNKSNHDLELIIKQIFTQ